MKKTTNKDSYALLKITSFNKNLSKTFVKQLKLLSKKKTYRNLFVYRGSSVLRKKNTILRSPHVHKKARDQIEVQHVFHYFRINSSSFWLMLLFLLKKKSLLAVKLDYKHYYSQELLVSLKTSSPSA